MLNHPDQIERKWERWMHKRGLIACMVAGLVLMTPSAPALAAESAQTASGAAGPAVSVAPAQMKIFTETILVTGSLVAREEVLVSPQIEGFRITEILAEEGDRVTSGQILARLSDDALKAQLAQLQANRMRADAAIEQARSRIKEAEANKSRADAAFARAEELIKSGTTSRSVFEEREADALTAAASLTSASDGLGVAQADKAQIEAQIREAELRLTYTEIRALADGVVSRRTAKAGALATAIADPLFRIIVKGEIELNAEVPEIYLPRIAKGQKAQVDVAGLKAREGTLRLVSPEVDPATRLGRVRIFIGADDELRVGSFARGIIDTGERRSIGIPASAILNRDDGAAVKIVKDGRVETRKVSVGMRNGGQAEIVDGLREGELVVLRSAMLLRDGDSVRPVRVEETSVSEAR
jgi:RND family efflux transporter MFP subunit